MNENEKVRQGRMSDARRKELAKKLNEYFLKNRLIFFKMPKYFN